MLLSVCYIVFQVVALGLGGVVILVFDLPAGTPGLNDFCYGFIAQWVMGGKRISIRHLSVRTAHGNLASVHQSSIIAISQGYPIEVPVGIGFLNFASPPFDGDVGRSMPSRCS